MEKQRMILTALQTVYDHWINEEVKKKKTVYRQRQIHTFSQFIQNRKLIQAQEKNFLSETNQQLFDLFPYESGWCVQSDDLNDLYLLENYVQLQPWLWTFDIRLGRMIPPPNPDTSLQTMIHGITTFRECPLCRQHVVEIIPHKDYELKEHGISPQHRRFEVKDVLWCMLEARYVLMSFDLEFEKKKRRRDTKKKRKSK